MYCRLLSSLVHMLLTCYFSSRLSALVAAQAHSPKADRAVVISSRNFLRSLGGACGLAIASALYSNTLVDKLPSAPAIPLDVADKIRSSIFSVPDLTGLSDDQKHLVLDAYTLASRSVFYFWVGCISCCWLLMFFIKDKGLQRKEEKEGEKTAPEGGARAQDEEAASPSTSGEDDGSSSDDRDRPPVASSSGGIPVASEKGAEVRSVAKA